MKFTTAVVATILAAAVSAQDTTETTTETTVATVTSTTEAPAATYSPTKEIKCQQEECETDDVACIAECWGVPSPNTAMVIDTTKCASECPQGNGTKEETDSYAACQQSCISSLFLPTAPTGGAAGGSGSNTEASGADATGTGSSKGDASSTTGSETAETSTSGAGRFAVPFAGFVGLVGVVFTVAL